MNPDQTDVVLQKAEYDLDMELLHPSAMNKLKTKSVKIIGTEIEQDHAVYKIQVVVGEYSWLVRRRYRDFCSLHEELVVNYGLPWDLLPPKKFLGNLNKEHIERRRVSLEEYLQTLLSLLLESPSDLVEFLEFDRFDVNSVCHKLAKDLYLIGDSILDNDEVFTIRPLQVHCINRRLLLPLPTCDSQDPRADIGHLYAFISQAKHIKVHGGEHGEFFTGEKELTYDLSIFKSLETLELHNCDLKMMLGIEVLQNQLWELKVTGSTTYLKDILVTSETWNQGVLVQVEEGKHRHVSRFPTWDNIVHAAFRHNSLTSIDNTITLLPNIRRLDLSHNFLTDVQYLEAFLYLREIDLSYNEITDVEDFPYKLGNITILNLAGNHLKDVKGLERMYSLKKLRLTDNDIEKFSNVLPLGNLPMLENVDLHGNPCTNEQFYNVRLIAQFGDRYQNVTIDGIPTIKSDLIKALEIIKLQNSYELITGPENYYRPGVTATSKDLETVNILTPPRSPRPLRSPKAQRKKKHIADIKPAPIKSSKQGSLGAIESEEVKFRDQIEKLREQAGDSWLTFYNEMAEEAMMNKKAEQRIDSLQRKAPSIDDEEILKQELKAAKPVNRVKPLHLAKDPSTPQDAVKERIRMVISAIITDDKYEEQLPGTVFNLLEDMMDQDVDLLNETFLVIKDMENTGMRVESIISFEEEDDSLLDIDLATGQTVGTHRLAKIRNIRVRKEDSFYWIVMDEETEENSLMEKGVWLEVEFKFISPKDCAGLFALIMTFAENESRDHMAENLSRSLSPNSPDPDRALPMDNPFHLKNELLLSFFQEFVQKTSKKEPEKKPRSNTNNSTNSANYQSIGIGVPFLKHAINDVPQDVVVTLWAGCLPYLFPEEELPCCVVMTNLNIFLFRIFLPDDATQNSLPKTVKEIKELFHCFYSFSLKSIREIVVGLYDQAFRIEVNEEGPRGTFTFLTRHASKTAEFLESYCSIIGFLDDRGSLDRRTSFVSVDHNSSIFYPDESKINALKEQLSEQDMNPLDDRENLISYCIVYVADTEVDEEEVLYSSDTPVSNIKSLILTNLRLFMCDEDYVHWPMPSFVRSLPKTPEWVVDEEQPVAELIGVDLWEDTEYKHNLVGNYGMTLTFDDSVAELTETIHKETCSKSWKIMFGSLSERDQFVRSLSCLWKNQFDQSLTVTYSKVTKLKPQLNPDTISQTSSSTAGNFKPGHSRGPSGNLTFPWNAQIDSPDMIVALNPIRQRTYFMDNIAISEEEGSKGPFYVMYTSCIPYVDPENEIKVTTLLGSSRIYLVVSEKNKRCINANKAIIDGSDGDPLWVAFVELCELRQVVVGVFDQFVRLEGDKPKTTFTLVFRDHEKTNEFLKSLSQVLLLGKHDEDLRETKTDTAQNLIYKYYKDEDAKSAENRPKTEFIHPNSDVKVVYPSDETLEKLRQNILEFWNSTYGPEMEEDFGILLYLLISAETDEGTQPCTLVISENFLCLLKEDYVNYPLPLFAKELPETPQYQPADARLIAAIIRIEFQDLSAGSFTIVFNRAVVDPWLYDQRFRTADVERDVCLVTDLNTDQKVQDEQGALLWKLQSQSFAEREKIFNVLSKMWTNSYSGKTLPIVKRKYTRLGDVQPF